MMYDDTDEKDHGLTDSVLLDGVGEGGVADEDAEDGSALVGGKDDEEEW